MFYDVQALIYMYTVSFDVMNMLSYGRMGLT